jgi:23S rRNA (guanosine2251-2'-O)-methyltransferase
MIVCGYHAVEESLRAGSKGSLLISRSSSRSQALKVLAARHKIPVQNVTAAELTRLCGHDRHQGAALVLENRERPQRRNLGEALASLSSPASLVLLLDELNDPHNLGAILRSADQFAVDLVITATRRSVSETPAVLKTSAGASRYVELLTVPNLVQAIACCKRERFWIYGADTEGENLGTGTFQGRVALVMGGEQKGLRRLVRESCDLLVRIPARGHVNSFNVSVAAGILLYEVRRQQGFPEL